MVKTTILLLALALSAVAAAAVIPRIVRFAYDNKLYDLPSERKTHTVPVPRLGGVCFMPVAMAVFALLSLVPLRLGVGVHELWDERNLLHIASYAFGAIVLFACGVVDDIASLGYRVKFAVQIVAGCSLCAGGLWIADLEHILWVDSVPWWVGMPLTVLFVVYLTNAVNLIDGIDGLASGLACVSLAVVTVLNVVSDNFLWALFSASFLGAVAAFFYYNVFSRRHKVFMGDTGSLSLGFVLSFLVLHFWQDGLVWNAHMRGIGIIAISTLVIPMLDVVRVMCSRLRDGRNPFLPDKNHIHHKLMRAGLSGHMTMAAILLMTVAIIGVNYALSFTVSQTLILLADALMFVAVHLVTNFFIFRREARSGQRWDRAM